MTFTNTQVFEKIQQRIYHEKVFHLKKFQQHHLILESGCEYSCLGCTHSRARDSITIPGVATAGDIVNIYGGGVHLSDQIEAILTDCQLRQLKPRVFTNHFILEKAPALLSQIDELMIWCPSPDPKGFDFIAGEPMFNYFKSALIEQRTSHITLVFTVRPLSFEILPEFYDLCVDLNVKGLILYVPAEFTREERRYIRRFKRVNNTRVIKHQNKMGNHCFAVPSGINGLGFEFAEWRQAMRQSFQRLPLLGRLV